jgi:hypothetical protein
VWDKLLRSQNIEIILSRQQSSFMHIGNENNVPVRRGFWIYALEFPLKRSAERLRAAYVKFIALHNKHCLRLFARVIHWIWRQSAASIYHPTTCWAGKKYLRKKTQESFLAEFSAGVKVDPCQVGPETGFVSYFMTMEIHSRHVQLRRYTDVCVSFSTFHPRAQIIRYLHRARLGEHWAPNGLAGEDE